MRANGLKYLTIYDELKKEITEGNYAIGASFPTEPALQERFNVSRITVRRAVQMLVDEGYLRRMHGVGTIVISQKESLQLQDLISFSKENDGKVVQSTLLSFEPYFFASSYICSKLDLPKNSTVSCHEKLRWVDEKVIGFQRVYCPNFLSLTKKEVSMPNVSLYEVFNEKGYRVTKANETIESVVADKKLAQRLKIEKGDPLLYVQRTTSDQVGRLVEFAEFFYRGDRYQYHVELQAPS